VNTKQNVFASWVTEVE